MAESRPTTRRVILGGGVEWIGEKQPAFRQLCRSARGREGPARAGLGRHSCEPTLAAPRANTGARTARVRSDSRPEPHGPTSVRGFLRAPATVL